MLLNEKSVAWRGLVLMPTLFLCLPHTLCGGEVDCGKMNFFLSVQTIKAQQNIFFVFMSVVYLSVFKMFAQTVDGKRYVGCRRLMHFR